MERNDVNQIFDGWQKGEVKLDFNINKIFDGFEKFMDTELKSIEALIDKDPWEAFGKLSTLISFANLSVSIYGPILKKLEKLLEEIKGIVDNLAKKLKADGYSISVGLPFGISFGISYNT